MSRALVMLMSIDIVVDVVVGCPCSPFISKGEGFIRKVSESVIIVVIVGLYL
jgi:hypothetical protein